MAVDLFSGAGGMSLGFEQAGFDVVAALELDRAHAAAHRFNFPWCDVVESDAALASGVDLRQAAARGLKALGRPTSRAQNIDVVFGGPPCQGFSVGGRLDPQDSRNELVAHFARIVAELNPAAFVLENVPAMASRALPGRDLDVPAWLAETMARYGYQTSPARILNASWFGVPQDRRRLILVGVRTPKLVPEPPPATVLAWPKTPSARPRPWELGHARSPTFLPLGPTVHDAIGDLPNLDEFNSLLTSDQVRLSAQQRTLMHSIASDYAARLAEPYSDPDDFSRRRVVSPHVLTSSLRTSHSPAVLSRFGALRPGTRDPVSRLYRLHDFGVAPTLRAGSAPDRGSYSAPRPIHPLHDRVISVREAARLSAFPDWFRFSAAKWHGFRQVGNAVSPLFARRLAASLRETLGFEPSVPPGSIQLGDVAQLRVPSGAGRRPRRHIGAGTAGYHL